MRRLTGPGGVHVATTENRGTKSSTTLVHSLSEVSAGTKGSLEPLAGQKILETLFSRAKVALDLLPARHYFRIGEVAKWVDVPTHVLRYWEQEIPSIKAEKSDTNQRRYRREDMSTFFVIKHLLYTEKYTLAGAKQKLKNHKQSVMPLNPINTAYPNRDLKKQDLNRQAASVLTDRKTITQATEAKHSALARKSLSNTRGHVIEDAVVTAFSESTVATSSISSSALTNPQKSALLLDLKRLRSQLETMSFIREIEQVSEFIAQR